MERLFADLVEDRRDIHILCALQSELQEARIGQFCFSSRQFLHIPV